MHSHRPTRTPALPGATVPSFQLSAFNFQLFLLSALNFPHFSFQLSAFSFSSDVDVPGGLSDASFINLLHSLRIPPWCSFWIDFL
jgi:hypothetical protein